MKKRKAKRCHYDEGMADVVDAAMTAYWQGYDRGLRNAPRLEPGIPGPEMRSKLFHDMTTWERGVAEGAIVRAMSQMGFAVGFQERMRLAEELLGNGGVQQGVSDDVH